MKTGAVLACCTLLLTGCDQFKDTAGSAPASASAPAASPTAAPEQPAAPSTPSDGWTGTTNQSAVHGTQFVATFEKVLNEEHQMREEIELTCSASEKTFSVKFTLYGDKESDPDFQIMRNTLAGPVVTVDGSGITAKNPKPHDAREMVRIGDYKNELILNRELIQDFPDELPLAMEIKSNQGTVTFQIPKSDVVGNVIAHCLPDEPAPSPSPAAEPPSAPPASAAEAPTGAPGSPESSAADAPATPAVPATPPLGVPASSATGNPKFKDYPAGPVYTGPSAALALDTDFARQYRTRLRDALTGPPVFAGEYVEATWGCGAGCQVNSFVSKRTGKVLQQGFGGETGPYVDTVKIDSRLLVARGPIQDKDLNEVGYAAFFYVLEGDQLKLIKQVSIPKPADASP